MVLGCSDSRLLPSQTLPIAPRVSLSITLAVTYLKPTSDYGLLFHQDRRRRHAEAAVTATLIHLKKLLRARDRHYSPFLRLPTGIIIHISSFAMEDIGVYPAWRPIFTTCYHIHRIMCDATSLWWKVSVSLGRDAVDALMRSKGNPRVVVSQFDPWDERETIRGESVLYHWKDQGVPEGHRLHTLEFFGSPSSPPRFSWIFEHSLLRLERLKFRVVLGLYNVVSDPIAVQLPTICHYVGALNLRNAALPWSSNLFTGLSELHLNYADVFVSPVEDELLRILDASPQLERLSPMQVEEMIPTGGDNLLHPKHIVWLPVLTFLKLDNDSKAVGYILAHTLGFPQRSLEFVRYRFPRRITPSSRSRCISNVLSTRFPTSARRKAEERSRRPLSHFKPIEDSKPVSYCRNHYGEGKCRSRRFLIAPYLALNIPVGIRIFKSWHPLPADCVLVNLHPQVRRRWSRITRSRTLPPSSKTVARHPRDDL